jgi:putative acetyltransferase
MIATEPPVDLEDRAAKFAEIIESDGSDTLLVLEEDGKVVGHAGVGEGQTPGVMSFGMGVIPAVRGRGGGRALLDAAIEHARAHGAHKLELEVWPENERAIDLYKSAGFEVEGMRRDHYRRKDGSLRSAVLMAKLL